MSTSLSGLGVSIRGAHGLRALGEDHSQLFVWGLGVAHATQRPLEDRKE